MYTYCRAGRPKREGEATSCDPRRQKLEPTLTAPFDQGYRIIALQRHLHLLYRGGISSAQVDHASENRSRSRSTDHLHSRYYR